MRLPLLILLLFVSGTRSLISQVVLLPEKEKLIRDLPIWKDESSFRGDKYIYRTGDPETFVIAYPANLDDQVLNPDTCGRVAATMG